VRRGDHLDRRDDVLQQAWIEPAAEDRTLVVLLNLDGGAWPLDLGEDVR
jgi:hypothetical protein